jgi:hypothetical protein
MGKKIFVSYKYLDSLVLPIRGNRETTARHYVDELQTYLDAEDHIFKGEDDGEDMSTLADSTIGSKLGDKIFDSTITVVLISKGMKEQKDESDQWIPWEISYSLKVQSREGRTSKTNGVLAVVLPDETGSYEYYINENICQKCNCRILKTGVLFSILRNNMFNRKTPVYSTCNNHDENTVQVGYSSYIYSVKWSDFVIDIDKYINIADDLRQNQNIYNLYKAAS